MTIFELFIKIEPGFGIRFAKDPTEPFYTVILPNVMDGCLFIGASAPLFISAYSTVFIKDIGRLRLLTALLKRYAHDNI